MIKSWLITFLVLILFAAAFYVDLFGLIASKGAFYTALVLVIIALLAAIKILGNPFGRVDDNDDKL